MWPLLLCVAVALGSDEVPALPGVKALKNKHFAGFAEVNKSTERPVSRPLKAFKRRFKGVLRRFVSFFFFHRFSMVFGTFCRLFEAFRSRRGLFRVRFGGSKSQGAVLLVRGGGEGQRAGRDADRHLDERGPRGLQRHGAAGAPRNLGKKVQKLMENPLK